MPQKTFSVNFETSGFRRATRKMNKVGDEADTAGSSFGNLGDRAQTALDGISAAASAALAGMGALVQQTGQYANQVRLASEQSGIAAEEIQEIANVAERVSGTSFDAVRDGLKELAIRSQEAANGTGEAKEAFDQLGISQQFLRESTPIEVFRRVQQELSGASEKMRIFAAETIFGGEAGEKLVEVLGMTQEEMNQVASETEELSGGQIQTLNDLNDEFNTLWQTLKNTGRQIAADLAPTIKNDLIPLLKDGANFAKQMSEAFKEMDSGTQKNIIKFTLFAAAASTVVRVLRSLISVGKTAVSVLGSGGLAKAVSSVVSAIGATAAGSVTLGSILGVSLASIMDTSQETAVLSDKIKGLATEVQNLQSGWEDLNQTEVADRLDEVSSRANEVRQSLKRQNDTLSQQRKRLEEMKTARENANSRQVRNSIQANIERQKNKIKNTKEEINVLNSLKKVLDRIISRREKLLNQAEEANQKSNQNGGNASAGGGGAGGGPIPMPDRGEPNNQPAGKTGGFSFNTNIFDLAEGQEAITLMTKAQRRMLRFKAAGRTATKALARGMNRLNNAFGRTVSNIITGQESFRSFGEAAMSALQGVLQQIIALIPKLAILKGLSFAFGGIGGATTISGALMNITGLASGGVVTGPTLAMVGEGSESEAVMPLSKLDQMIGNAGRNITVQVTGQTRTEGRVIKTTYDTETNVQKRQGRIS